MPNWVQNTIRVTENIEKFKEVFIPNGEIDFNRIIPMPEDLDIQSGGSSYKPNKAGYNATDFGIVDLLEPLWNRTYTDNVSQADFKQAILDNFLSNSFLMQKAKDLYSWFKDDNKVVDYIKDDIEIKSLGYFNYKRYGFVDWYQFKNEKWGTKWNVNNDETYIIENTRGLFVTFKTAWGIPFGILSKLAEQFSFSVLFADEDRGYNMGIVHFTKGNTETVGLDEFEDVTDQNERYAIANIIWGDDYDITSEELEDIGYEPISEDRYDELYGLVAPYLP